VWRRHSLRERVPLVGDAWIRSSTLPSTWQRSATLEKRPCVVVACPLHATIPAHRYGSIGCLGRENRRTTPAVSAMVEVDWRGIDWSKPW